MLPHPPHTTFHCEAIMASFLVEAMVTGYHVYKDIWATVVSEEMPCQHEDGNRADSFAIVAAIGCSDTPPH